MLSMSLKMLTYAQFQWIKHLAEELISKFLFVFNKSLTLVFETDNRITENWRGAWDHVLPHFLPPLFQVVRHHFLLLLAFLKNLKVKAFVSFLQLLPP